MAEDLIFEWKGTDRTGKKISGETKGTSATSAKVLLRKQGINVKTIKKKSKPLFSFGSKITPADIALFTRQLATMMKAGVPLVQSFDIVAGGVENPAMKDLITYYDDNNKSRVAAMNYHNCIATLPYKNTAEGPQPYFEEMDKLSKRLDDLLMFQVTVWDKMTYAQATFQKLNAPPNVIVRSYAAN